VIRDCALLVMISMQRKMETITMSTMRETIHYTGLCRDYSLFTMRFLTQLNEAYLISREKIINFHELIWVSKSYYFYTLQRARLRTVVSTEEIKWMLREFMALLRDFLEVSSLHFGVYIRGHNSECLNSLNAYILIVLFLWSVK
jgi:hypothetical protein